MRPRRRLGEGSHPERAGRGLTVIELIVALGVLGIALAAIYGLVAHAARSFGVSEDFLDVQQNARQALERLAEEARWAVTLVDDAAFFARPPAGPRPPACPDVLCADSVNLSIPAANPVIGECAYYVRFSFDATAQTLVREVRPDPAQSSSGTGTCVAATHALASHVGGLAFSYCTAAGACGREGIAAADAVRLVADITVRKTSGGRTQQRDVTTEIALRNVGTAGAGAPASPTPTPPWRPTPGGAVPTGVDSPLPSAGPSAGPAPSRPGVRPTRTVSASPSATPRPSAPPASPTPLPR